MVFFVVLTKGLEGRHQSSRRVVLGASMVVWKIRTISILEKSGVGIAPSWLGERVGLTLSKLCKPWWW